MKSVMRLTAPLVFCLLHSSLAFPQEKAKKDKKTEQVQTSAPATPAAPRQPLAFGLTEDTPVRIKLTRTMSSKDAKAAEKVDFEVLEDVKVGEVIVIKQGAMAIATVTEAQPKRRMGRAGKLNMNIDYVQLVDGEKVSLRAVKGGNGGDHVAAMTGAMVATSIVFFPAAPLFLFMHGKVITIPKRTDITVYINGDMNLDAAKFGFKPASGGTAAQGTASVAQAVDSSSVIVKSTPDGA